MTPSSGLVRSPSEAGAAVPFNHAYVAATARIVSATAAMLNSVRYNG